MQWMSNKRFVVALALACGLAGCKSGNAPQAVPSAEPKASSVEKPAEPASQTPIDPETLGDVTGIVRFAGKAPAPIKIDTSMDPACGFGGPGDVRTEQYAIKGDRLANVYIYVKNAPSAVPPQANPAPVVLDQKRCVYTPHVIAVRVGQPVEFRNSDPTMHNIHTMPAADGNAALDMSQGPKGKPQVKTFSKPEIMMPVRCNNHPWMNAFLNVSATPWFAISGPDGKFVLKGLPAGEYTIGAVQEKLGEQEFKVKVKPKAAEQADFTFAIK